MFKNLLLTLTLCTCFFFVSAQKVEQMDAPPIVCHASHINEGTRLLNPDHLRRQTAEKTSNIVVKYNGFSPQAQAAFQYAVDIWEGLINSPVTIYIDATWKPLDQGVLGSAGAGTYFRNFEGAKRSDTWYPVALAEKMAGRDLNTPGTPDIVANFSSTFNWYLGTDGNTSGNQYDLATVVLHEIGHGLGFAGSFSFAGGNGTFGSNTAFPFIYDQHVENQTGQLLISLGSGTSALGSAVTSNQVFFNSPYTTAQNGSAPRLYAPATWNGGSSMSHLDEATYFSGSPNSLMSPQVGANEVIHNPGPITMNMFGDMGWEYNYTSHKPRNSDLVEADSFLVYATIMSDAGVNPNSVELHYSLSANFSNPTTVAMSPTGNPGEFVGSISSAKIEGQEYFDYVTSKDSKGRSFSKPSFAPNTFFKFKTATDNTDPIIGHNAPPFIKNTDTELSLIISVSDFLPLEEVKVEYSINGTPAGSSLAVKDNSIDSIFVATIDLTQHNIQIGDVFTYTISATDKAVESNSSILPTQGNFTVNVIGLLPTQESYANNFNTASNDFFESNHFSIASPTGFTNGAIHSSHPYPNGPEDSFVNYTYELKIPILLRETQSYIYFDEIVLVEPSETGAIFGDPEFWDYVIVEGSIDGGVTWTPFLDGYDSRSNDAWLTAYNQNIVESNSNTVGTPNLYRSRTIDMLANGEFTPGQEVIVRFRLYSDEAAHGWGWAIDNLRIQTDEIGPTITHSFIDYTNNNLNDFEIVADVTDISGVDSVVIITQINNENLVLNQFNNSGTATYQSNLPLTDLVVGDVARYRIVAFDTIGNISYLPSETGFIEIPYVEFEDPLDDFSTDFNTESNDFLGNFFSIKSEPGFQSNAIHSEHQYLNGFSADGTSDFSFTLKHPIKIAERKPEIIFSEIAIIEPSTGTAIFGEEGFNDYVVVEGSKDNGINWTPFEAGYNSKATGRGVWLTAYNNKTNGDPTMFRERVIDMTTSGDFAVGDTVIVRFRMHSNSTNVGWGWAIDNLKIQSNSVLGTKDDLNLSKALVYPNPNNSGVFNINLGNEHVIKSLTINVIGLDGSIVLNQSLKNIETKANRSIHLDNIQNGVYIIQLISDSQTESHKVILIR